jgi:hypothetical protein
MLIDIYGNIYDAVSHTLHIFRGFKKEFNRKFFNGVQINPQNQLRGKLKTHT